MKGERQPMILLLAVRGVRVLRSIRSVPLFRPPETLRVRGYAEPGVRTTIIPANVLSCPSMPYGVGVFEVESGLN